MEIAYTHTHTDVFYEIIFNIKIKMAIIVVIIFLKTDLFSR
jgi:hypothetical protein